ncbi:stage II sporulation protein E [Dendrosporobacter sp. 1207_IL3150]|uniref:stage II sporulation protein E n=1 Tax=Dendrosporobacter sp. 1207_IL3150 TaxID=3084054 RepID=UPI002FDA9519
MPKVTVVTLPEQALHIPKTPPVVSQKPRRRKLALGNIFLKLRDLILPLIHRDNLILNMLAFMLSRLTILGEVSPFGIAFFAAAAQAGKGYAPGVAVWSIVGVISTGNYSEAWVYLLSTVLFFRWQDKLNMLNRKLMAVPLLMFCTVTAGGLILSFIEQGTLYNSVAVLFNAAICMVSAYIFMYGVPLLLSGTRTAAASQRSTDESLVCMIAILAIAIAGIGNLSLFEYSLRSISGSLLVLLLALVGGAGLGAAVGVAVGFVIGLTDGNVPLAISLYAVAGAMGGAFRSLGKYVVIAGFILGSIIINLCFNQVTELINALSETIIACMLFMAVPARKISILRENLNPAEVDTVAVIPQVNDAAAKMSNIAEMFNDLAGAFGTIAADTKEKIRDEELARVLTAVGEQVCEKCEMRSKCWEQDFYRTYQSMLEMLGQAESNNLSVNNIPESLKEGCLRRRELIEVFNLVIEKNQTVSFWQKRIADHRQLVTEQMKAAGSIINNLAQEVIKVPRSDRELAAVLKERASLIDCCLENVRVIGAKGSGTIEARKQPCSGMRECVNTVLPLAAGVMREKMTLHAECGNKNQKCKLSMQVTKRFNVETGIASAAKEAQGVCGDTCSVMPLNKGKMVLMLSDGMGCGSHAAKESTMAVSFLGKLLSVGFDVDVAVKTVNSMLLLRTPEESFATVDMAIVDTYSGEVEFLKIGSAPSFVKRVREVSTVKSSSLPMGIINQIEIEVVKASLVGGDIMVMVSDGIADIPQRTEKDNWVANFLRRTSSTNPQELADSILQEAVKMSGGYVRDDMTVLVAKIGDQPSLV